MFWCVGFAAKEHVKPNPAGGATKRSAVEALDTNHYNQGLLPSYTNQNHSIKSPSSNPYETLVEAGLYEEGGSVQTNGSVVVPHEPNGFIPNPAAVYDNDATIDIEPEEFSTKFWSCSHVPFTLI